VVNDAIAATIAVVMPAAGEGRRLGLEVPKALADIAGRPMVGRALQPFAAVPGVIEVVVLVPAEAVTMFASVLARTTVASAALRVIVGGKTRQESVRLGVEALRSSPEVICVHDAARPLTTTTLISAVIAAACRERAATAAARPVDSVRQDMGPRATRALDRSSLWLVQTPQAFSSELLREAHRRAEARGITATDDASLVEKVCGAAVAVVPNDTPNLKVTTIADLVCVRALLR